MGAPKGSNSKFTVEAREAIISHRRIGMPMQFCAQAAEISEKTLYTWVKLGNEHTDAGIESDFATFSIDLKRAESEGITAHLGKIHRSDSWQSSAWILSRCWPQYFGKLVEEHPPAPVVIQTDGSSELAPEVENHPDVQEAIAHYSDVVARVERELA